MISFPAYLKNGNYQPKKAVATLSNAMDVGNPSNFVRILELFHKEFNSLKDTLSSYSISDKETKDTIEEVYSTYNYLLDPHGAVGYLLIEEIFRKTSAGKKEFFLKRHIR